MRQTRRLVGVAVLLCVGTAAVLGSVAGRQPDPSSSGKTARRADSACDGRIEEWLLSLPVKERSFFLATEADLIAKADPAVRFRVLTSDAQSRAALERAVRARHAPALERVTWFRYEEAVSPWTRDYFVMASAPDGRALALLHHPEHYARAWGAWTSRDPRVYTRCLSATETLSTTNRLEGGQVVADAERAFVSRAVLAAAGPSAGSEAATREVLEGELGLPVTWVPYFDLGPSDHIDLYLMVLPGRRVLLSSPRLGARLLQRMSAGARAGFAERLRERAAAEGVRPAVLAPGRDLVDTLVARSTQPRCLEAFERLRARVTSVGYTVIEAPYLFLDGARDGLQLCLSYTNVVQDERDGKRTAYVPTYGLGALDREAQAIWRRLGYRVVAIEALGPALVCGSVRCLSQVRTSLPGRSKP